MIWEDFLEEVEFEEKLNVVNNWGHGKVRQKIKKPTALFEMNLLCFRNSNKATVPGNVNEENNYRERIKKGR